MKKILLRLAFVCLPAFAFTQSQTYFSDNFNDEDVSDWTRYDVDGDGNQWADYFQILDSNSNPITPVSLISRSWQVTALTPDNWIISPAIDLSTATASTELTWKVQTNKAPFNAEKYSVYVGTANDMASLQASAVQFTETVSNTAGTQSSKSLDVSALNGQTIYVAFRHYGVTDIDFISIDDVKVADAGAPTPTPSCVQLLSPADGATNVVYNPAIALSWEADPNAESYDVYFGTSATLTTPLGTTANTAVNITNASPSTTYYWKIVPKNSAGAASGCVTYSFTTEADPFAPYCSANLKFSSGVEPITKVTLNDLSNASPASTSSAPMENFISKVATVEQGKTYPITFEGNTNGNYIAKFLVFIDWNQNGTFEASELFFGTAATTVTLTNSTGTDGKTATGNIVVPADAPLGTTRMRIKKNFGSTFYLSPCYSSGTTFNATTGTAGYGQVEDYTINVIAPTLGITDLNKTKVSLYPNPVSDVLHIQTAAKNTEVAIYNTEGRLVRTAKNANSVNVRDLATGNYVVKVKSDNSVETFKVIKK